MAHFVTADAEISISALCYCNKAEAQQLIKGRDSFLTVMEAGKLRVMGPMVVEACLHIILW